MKKYILVIFFFVSILSAQVRAPFETANGEQRFANLGNLRLENGQEIENARVGYRLFGNFRPDLSNIVVYLTWFGGNSISVSRLLGQGKIIDTEKYGVIIIDALGNGVSSSPSNTKGGFEKFPRFTVRDMVRSQYLLLTEHLTLSRVHAVVGGSMGGMQAMQWLVSYPNFMEKIIAYVGTPKLTSYDLLYMNTMRYHLENLKKYGASEAEKMHSLRLIMAIGMDSAAYRVKKTSVEEFPQFFASLAANPHSSMNSDDFLSQLYAMLAHDISFSFGGSLSEAASRVQAQVLLIVSLQDHLLYPQPALDFAKMIQAQTLILDNELGHLAVSQELPRVSKTVDDFLSQPRILPDKK